MVAQTDVRETHRFGKFLLQPQRRSLTAAGQKVELSARAFDLLCLLIERRDRIVTKDELRAEIWRGMTVDDNNLAVQMSLLRRALGEKSGGPQYILTVPGQGYQFIAPLDATEPPAQPPPPAPTLAPHNISSIGPAAIQAAAELPPAPPKQAAKRLPLALASLLAALLAAAWLTLPNPWAPKPAPRLSIAVLPFRNLGPDTEQNYLADAISDDLTTDLSHIPESIVIARTSADTYRGRAVPAADIGQALNVRYLLEGSLRAEGPQLHINAQLIDAATGSHLWARAFDVPQDKLGTARADIVRNIASALNVTLVDIESARSETEHPRNGDAEDDYLRARSVLSRSNTFASLGQAQILLEKAVATDAQFAEALALLGLVLVYNMGDFDDPSETADYARAKVVISDAVSIAPHNAAAIAARGYLAWLDGHYEEGRASFDLALSLDASDVQARMGLALCDRELGRMQEMIDGLQALRRIDPASPSNAKREHLLGFGYLMLGQPEQAIEWLQRAGAGLGEPSLDEVTIGWQEWRQIYLIAANEMAGRHAVAAAQYAAYSRLRPRRTIWRLVNYDTRPEIALPAHKAYVAALAAAGMPAFAREDADFGTLPTSSYQQGGDFDPTPLSIPGATRIDTATLRQLLARPPAPLMLDVGRGSAVPVGAVWAWSDTEDSAQALVDHTLAAAHASHDTPIVVLSDGTTGWDSYNTAEQLVAEGFRSVLWYRGGEEAWQAAGYKAVDRRPRQRKPSRNKQVTQKRKPPCQALPLIQTP